MVCLIASQMEEHKLMRSSFQQSYMGSVALTAPLVFKLMIPEDFTLFLQNCQDSRIALESRLQ